MKSLSLLLTEPLLEQLEKERQLAPEVISSYQALWHPHLLHDASAIPSLGVLTNTAATADHVLAIPAPLWRATDPLIQKDLTASGAKILTASRPLSADTPLELTADLPTEDAELARDFFAVGYAYLGLTIVLRLRKQLERLDNTNFWSQIQQAAGAYVDGDFESARPALGAAVDVLSGNRQAAYPATINWIDMALISNPGQDDGIIDRLENSCPVNLILTAHDLEQLTEPTLEAIRRSLNSSAVDVLGGTATNRPLPLLPHESRIWELRRAIEIHRQRLSRDLDCFASRAGALSSELPQLLMKFEFRYALHAALDGSRFPILRGPKLHWTASDGSVVESLARTPINASSDNEGLAIFDILHNTLANDRSATVVLAHWSSRPAAWYQALLRVQQLANVFGKFETFSEYFLHSSLPEGATHTRAGEYQTTYLQSSGESVDKSIQSHRARGRFDAARSMDAMALVAGSATDIEWDSLENDLELGGDANGALADVKRRIQIRLAEIILGRSSQSPGYLIINPCGHARRASLLLEDMPRHLDLTPPLKAFEWGPDLSAAIVDVPGWGFAWISKSASAATETSDNREPVASGRRLKNTMIEVEIDKATGGIRGIWSLRDRYNRLSQQLVHSKESRAVCKQLIVNNRGSLVGEIKTIGELVGPDKRVIADFEQTFRVWRGRPVLAVTIQLTPRQPLAGDPLENYLACRWAWPDDKTPILASSGLELAANYAPLIEASSFFEIREQHMATNVVTAGAFLHRRVSHTFADTVLVIPGGQTRVFQFQIGLDVANPWQLHQSETWPLAVIPVDKGPPASGSSGWLVKLAGEGIVASSLAPIAGSDPGVRLRLAEVSGQSRRAELRLARSPAEVRLTTYRGQTIYDLHQEDDFWPIDVSGREWQQVEWNYRSESTDTAGDPSP